MADFNKVLEVGDWQNGVVNTVVEIPEGSILKIEWDRGRATFTLDRVEPAIFAKPCNYGFIPQTLDEDGDELDTLVVTDEPIPTGVWLEAKVLGVLNFEDESEEVFQKLFEHYGMNRHLIIGEQLNGQKILDIAKPTSDALIYISGPEPMVEALQKGLESSGIEKSRLVGDFFPGYTIV